MATSTIVSPSFPPITDKISFAEPLRPRRFSDATTGTDDEFEESVYEDWSKITDEKDSWANRERRRSNKFATFDNDVALQKLERTRSGRRGSSALGIFSHGVDKNGNPVIMSDDHHEGWDVPVVEIDQDSRKTLMSSSIGAVFRAPDERRLSMSSQASDKRRGSILSLWKTGKDKDGRDHVHSGHEGDDWVETVSLHSSSSAPASPNIEATRGDRRGSILSIWRQGKDREGRTVMHSGEEHDEIVATLDADGQPVVVEKKELKVGDEKFGSVLSIWSQGKDKDGKTVIHSGEEHDGVIELPVEKVESPKMKGQERRGSVLSMWTDDKRDTQDRPAAVALKAHDEEEV